jgi:tRNA dimethylallyltransferase
MPQTKLQPLVVALVGPTCSGKTALALALSRKLEAEIVACDSRTVYRQMNIGTAKPSSSELSQTPHHMIDIVDPSQTYTVAQYKEEASAVLDEVLARRRLPIVCGGTGFYARALLEGLTLPAVAPQSELRKELQELADQQGNESLHSRLKELDPTSAARINLNDRFRLVRALEVCLVFGKPFSELAKRSEPAYRTLWLGLTTSDRKRLYQAIERRMAEQMQSGLVAEVTDLFKLYGPCRTLLNTVNYKEIIQYLQGECSLKEAQDLCIRHNCQLARKQLIWFRANPKILWLEVDRLDSDQLISKALESIGKTIGN